MLDSSSDLATIGSMTTWYRKKTDPKALYQAESMGVRLMFEAMGERIHENDMEHLIAMLDFPRAVVLDLLFEKEDLSA